MLNAKRSAMALLLLSFAAGALAACSPTSDALPETSAATQAAASTETVTTADDKPKLPELDFDGASFTTVHYDLADYTTVYFTEAENGDAFNDAVYARARAVEEALNVKMRELVLDHQKIHPTVSKSVLAGEDAYQLAVLNIAGVCSMLTDRLILDWNNIPHVDFDRPYWNAKAIETLSLAGKKPYAVGDFIVTDPSALMFNKELVKSLALDDPYRLVLDGEWTWTRLTEIAQTVTADVDGDGAYTNADRYGFVAPLNYQFAGVLHSCGQYVVTKDADGTPRLALNNEKTANIINMVYKLLYETNSSFLYKHEGERDPKTGLDFPTGRALFFMYKISRLSPYRDTEVEFGILPFPKYDEAQDGYYALTWGSVMCAPITARPELVGAVTEQLNYESRARVLPAYYDVTLNGKLTRDEESAEMLALIFDGTVYEFGLNYSDFGTALYIVSNMMNARSTDVASYYEKNLRREEQHYLDLYESVKGW